MARPAPQADSVFWKFANVGTQAHAALYKVSRGRLGGSSSGAPTVLLEHVGRRSGKHRTTPLVALPDGDNLIIMASKGGVEQHPLWYLNLMESPVTDIWWKGEKRHVRAHTVTGPERTRLWKAVVDAYPQFGEYQERTDREIPVVVLEPAG